MAEFQIVARAYVRMCESYPTCEGCPINEPGNDIDTCRCCVLKWPCKYESKIMSWAAAHPEPVYPTWVDWLVDQGLIFVTSNTYAFNFLKATDPIPPDIAQKLGIEPKEET